MVQGSQTCQTQATVTATKLRAIKSLGRSHQSGWGREKILHHAVKLLDRYRIFSLSWRSWRRVWRPELCKLLIMVAAKWLDCPCAQLEEEEDDEEAF